MELLKVVEITLSNNRDVISRALGLSNEEVYKRVAAYIEHNSDQWQEHRPNINYADPICRLAYIYMNVPIHSYLIEHCLEQVSITINEVLDKEFGQEINICAVGGGPGSELVGLTSFLFKAKKSKKYHLDFLLVDLIKEWDESWHTLKQSINDYQRSIEIERSRWPVIINRSFIPLNALSKKDFEGFPIRLNGINLYFFSYVFSELRYDVEAFQKTFSYISSMSKSGTLFFFIDRSQTEVKNGLENLLHHAGLKILHEVPHLSGSVNFQLDLLKEWYLNLERLPRRTYKAFFVLAVKI
jgi:hypothetical protein